MPAEVAVLTEWPEDVVCGVDRQAAKKLVTLLGDAKLRVRLAGRVACGRQAKECSDRSALRETLCILLIG
jgi:hypothetical protein